jgi:hypothetical protein
VALLAPGHRALLDAEASDEDQPEHRPAA